MRKNQNKGNIVFFIGVVIFVISLAVGYFTEVSAVIIDLAMGVGLIIEFIGLCICYKKDKKELKENENISEEKAIEEEKENIKEEKLEEVIEVVEEPTIEEPKNTTNKKNTNKKSSNKKTGSKKTTSTKKKNTTKKKTTKKTNTKKTTK